MKKLIYILLVIFNITLILITYSSISIAKKYKKSLDALVEVVYSLEDSTLYDVIYETDEWDNYLNTIEK